LVINRKYYNYFPIIFYQSVASVPSPSEWKEEVTIHRAVSVRDGRAVTVQIPGFMGFVHRPVPYSQKTQHFGNCMFTSSGEGRDSSTLLGSLERLVLSKEPKTIDDFLPSS
jgi:hypothetical protein